MGARVLQSIHGLIREGTVAITCMSTFHDWYKGQPSSISKSSLVQEALGSKHCAGLTQLDSALSMKSYATGSEGVHMNAPISSSIQQDILPPPQQGAHIHEAADSSSDSCPSPRWVEHHRQAPGFYSSTDGEHSSGSYTPTESSSGSAGLGRRPLSTIQEVDSDLQCSPLGLGLAATATAAADAHARYTAWS